MPKKTQQEAQIIFDVLVSALEAANHDNRSYIFYKDMVGNKRWPTPLERYLDLLKEGLAPRDFKAAFFSKLYHEVFHTGPIPKNRNHILMTSQMDLEPGYTAPVLTFWVDLDKVATLLNAHLKITPPYRFKLEYQATSDSGMVGVDSINVWEKNSTAVNSRDNPSTVHSRFLLGCMLSGAISGYALLVVALAVASIVTLSTAGIGAAVGVGLVAGVTSYGLFKAKEAPNTKTVAIEPNAERIENIFQEHYKDLIDSASANRMS